MQTCGHRSLLSDCFSGALLICWLCTEDLTLACRFILKSILYDPAIRTAMLILPCEPARLDAFLSSVNISSKRPFMLQQLMNGPEYSCYALADRGRLVAHADTSAQLSNLNFKHLGRPEIQDFTARLCSALKLDGQVC